jgi:hypothetical protein
VLAYIFPIYSTKSYRLAGIDEHRLYRSINKTSYLPLSVLEHFAMAIYLVRKSTARLKAFLMV